MHKGKTLLLLTSSSSALGFLRLIAGMLDRTGSVMPTQVWLFQETFLLWLFIRLAKYFPQGWILLSLSCVSSPSAAMPHPGDKR